MRGAEKGVAGAGVAVLAFAFLPGFAVPEGPYKTTESVLSMGVSARIGIGLALAAALWAALRRTGLRLPRFTGIEAERVALGLSSFGLLALLYRIIDLPSGGGGVAGIPHYDFDRRAGLFLVVAASAIQTLCAYLASREGRATVGA